ncbi:hypothetical protein ASG90_06645 [Nocardioides sp. Soil797]|nr:hypothetical protein ASG90_06645 [Nocardioides sp. Soil797]
MVVLREALRAGSIEFLEAISTLMSAVDARGRDPFSREEEPGLDDLIESFIEVDIAETTAALTVISTLVPDELMAAKVGRELSRRRQPVPDALTRLDEAEVSRVMEMTETLGDGDDYFLDVTLATGEQMTALVYVDHNLGTVVKDAFLIPAGMAEVIERVMPALSSDQFLTEADPATARAVITEAIDGGARFWPPITSDSWPQCRPVVEWLVRRLPAGGSVPDRPSWDQEHLAALAEDFFVSADGRELDHADERGLLESLLWFGTDYGPGNPLRWSPVNVEMLLTDWLPRKVMADPEFLAKAPRLLRGFIRFCHRERRIPTELTASTLASVDRWEPDYQRAIRSDRPQGPAALVARLLDQDGLDTDDRFFDDDHLDDYILRMLDGSVGGRDALISLDREPLPDEPFDWQAVPEDIRERVAEVLELSDRCAVELLDTEHRTAMRRFLARASVNDPTIFRRKGAPERAAAAVAWAVARANGSLSVYGLQTQELLAWFGVKGSVSQRAEPFLRANGVDPHAQFGPWQGLGDPGLLVSRHRGALIEKRDQHLSST